MDWLTEDLKERLLENGRRKAECDTNNLGRDLVPLIYLRLPGTSSEWLIASLFPNDPDLAFGLCQIDGTYPVLGEVRLSELEKVTDSRGMAMIVESLNRADPFLGNHFKSGQ